MPEEESMWVRIETGTCRNGTGILDNDPAYTTEVKCGDLIEYKYQTDGDEDLRVPEFVRKAP